MSDYQLPLNAEINYSMSFDDAVVTQNELLHLPAKAPALRTDSWKYLVLKRGLDICGSVFLLALCAPLCLVIALLLAVTTREPIFYQEWRVGRGGRPFRIVKFRSMRSTGVSSHPGKKNSPSNLLQWRVNKDGRDPRITTVGKFLRQWSLDELPQLWNVLRGEMSLVGPRPVVEAEIPLYGTMSRYYYAAAPGLSGLWQVSGRSNITFQARVALDVTYVLNWSLTSDCRILLKTLPAVLHRTGAR